VSWPLLVSAAEASGDLLGGPLVAEISNRRPDMHITGIAGPALRAAGVAPIGRVEDLGAAGLVEVLPALPRLIRLRRRLQAALNEGRPRVSVLIDAPDLHLALHGPARRAGVRTVQLVAPQFWAWRPGRARRLASVVDRVLCLFRWEVDALAAHGADAVWVGHPVLERAQAMTRTGGRERLCLALLPGSRTAERARCLPAFLAAAQVLAAERDLDVVVSGPLGTRMPDGVRLDPRPGLQVLAAADVALVAAGTATLEAALLGVPFVCAAALHPISAAVAKRLLSVDHVALPNIILGRRAIPEVVQDLSVQALAPPLRPFLEDPLAGQIHSRMLAEELRSALGPPGFAARAADAVLELGDRP
jgi:lipid-A-disaccharide synthase